MVTEFASKKSFYFRTLTSQISFLAYLKLYLNYYRSRFDCIKSYKQFQVNKAFSNKAVDSTKKGIEAAEKPDK